MEDENKRKGKYANIGRFELKGEVDKKKKTEE